MNQAPRYKLSSPSFTSHS